MSATLRRLRQGTDPIDLTAADHYPDSRDTHAADSEVFETLQKIEDLANDDDYAWAIDTLTGIQSTIERTRRVTSGQKRAIANIENSRSNRRY